MSYNTYTLENGLRVIHLNSSSNIVYCGYAIRGGTRDELSQEEGLAHFCEHVTFKGTSHRSAMQVLNCLERVGGEINAFTNKEDTIFYSAILKNYVPLAIDLLTDIVFHSTYPKDQVEKEIEVICDEIESYNDTPSELIYDEFERTMFFGHSLGHNILGNSQRLRQYTREDALRFTSKFYKPENSVFFAYGNIDFKSLVKLLSKSTSDFPKREPQSERKPKEKIPQYIPKKIIQEKGTHQAHVMIGNRAYDIHNKKRIALYLLNNIIGGPGMNARLNVSLREKHGLVYSVDSSMVNYSDTGLWCAYFGCDSRDVSSCLELVRKELDKVIKKPLSSRGLSLAKKQILGQISIACDNRESFALDFAKSYLHYGWERDIFQLIQDIEKVSIQDILEVALEVFSPSDMTTLIFL